MAETAAPETHIIPAERLSLVQAGVDKLNRRAKKLGFEPVVLVASEPRAIRRMKSVWHEGSSAGPGGYSQYPVTIWVRDVRLTGVAPRINGFEFQAALTHTAAGNLVSRAPGVETDLSGWREASPRCQHCGLDRNRGETFVLKAPTGELVQIGRNCLVDYIGTTDVAQAVQLWKALQEFEGGLGEDGEYGFGGGWVCPTTPEELVTAALASVRRRGFVKTTSDGQSTRGHAEWILGPEPKYDERRGWADRDEWRACQPTEAQRAEAKAMIEWALASTDSSDYMFNIRVALQQRTLIQRSSGLLASLPVAYDKHLGKLQERKERPKAGPHVGTVGQRIDVKVVVKFEMMLAADPDRRFSVSKALLIMVDENNSAYKTFASGQLKRVEDLKEGEWYLRGTVKKHEADKKTGEPVTIMQRCEMSRTPFPPLKAKKAPGEGKPRRKSTKGTQITRRDLWLEAGLHEQYAEGESPSDHVANLWVIPEVINWSNESYRAGRVLVQQSMRRTYEAIVASRRAAREEAEESQRKVS